MPRERLLATLAANGSGGGMTAMLAADDDAFRAIA
jgi:hypothetical protein